MKCYMPNIKALDLPVSEKKNFEGGLLCSYFQTCEPRGRANFDPRGIKCPNLVEVYKQILHTKYQSSMPSSFREDNFQILCYFFSFWLTWLQELWVEFNLLNNFSRASPKGHSCQVSTRLAQWFSRRCLTKILWTTEDAARATDTG